jgi:hypothetical protein
VGNTPRHNNSGNNICFCYGGDGYGGDDDDGDDYDDFF